MLVGKLPRKREEKFNIYAVNYWNAIYFTEKGVMPNDFHETITSLSNDWWHYCADMYIVATTRKARWLKNKIIKRHPKLPFIVSEIGDFTGQLPKNAWEWLQKYGRKPL